MSNTHGAKKKEKIRLHHDEPEMTKKAKTPGVFAFFGWCPGFEFYDSLRHELLLKLCPSQFLHISYTWCEKEGKNPSPSWRTRVRFPRGSKKAKTPGVFAFFGWCPGFEFYDSLRHELLLKLCPSQFLHISYTWCEKEGKNPSPSWRTRVRFPRGSKKAKTPGVFAFFGWCPGFEFYDSLRHELLLKLCPSQLLHISHTWCKKKGKNPSPS